jgi:diaminopimelate decarboxylase
MFGDIDQLAAQYDTPLVIYSQVVLDDCLRELSAALPPTSSLVYSIKANPNLGLIRNFCRAGLMAEAASTGELALALRAGMDGKRLMLGGPAKKTEAFRLACETELFAVLVESANDLEGIRREAKRQGKRVDVLLRVNPSNLPSQSVLRMAGLPSQFGIDESEVPSIQRAFKGNELSYAGLFMYAGSQHFKSADIASNTRHLCEFAKRMIGQGLDPPRVLDFGGGFGLSEAIDENELDLSALRSELGAVFAEHMPFLKKNGLKHTLFESGRYLVGKAGIYVTRVVDVRSSGKRRFAILDGGINHLGVRQKAYRTHELSPFVLGRETTTSGSPVTLVGPSCSPVDVTHPEMRVSDIQIGDLVIIPHFGAYSISYSPIHFCGHPWPSEVIVSSNGAAQLLRRRGEIHEACGIGYL